MAERPLRQKTYGQRAQQHPNALAKRLLELMETKKTNLSVSADLTKSDEVVRLADTVGPFICVFKTHVDIIEDFSFEFVTQLQNLARKHDFLIFEDRKFADIGNTVKLQYEKGVYRIASWADIVNCHSVPGEGVIQGLKEIGLPKSRGLLLLAEMSSEGNLAKGDYTDTTVEWARKHKDFVIGFIGMRKLGHSGNRSSGADYADSGAPDFITMTPGVGLEHKGDNQGQQYKTPDQVINENMSDIIIVGRGIYGKDKDWAQEAQRYRDSGWAAYQTRINSD